MGGINLTIKGGTPFGDAMLNERKLARIRAQQSAIDEALDWMQHENGCNSYRDIPDNSCTCGLWHVRAGLEALKREMEG
jgi:hypothetical protein